jgi:hypothetical protein
MARNKKAVKDKENKATKLKAVAVKKQSHKRRRVNRVR